MTTILEVANLRCVRGERQLFSDLNFSLSPGNALQLSGPNGSGKTSLLRIVCGLLAPTEGEVRWLGSNIRSLGEEYSQSLSYIGHRNGVKEELNATENLRIANGLAGISLAPTAVKAALEKIGLGGREKLPARLLSEGQQRRLALGRLLTARTKLWVLDEVLTSLDRAAVALIQTLIGEHLQNGGMAIIATHQELDLSAGSLQRLELAT
jgi:heme exporter protein A